MSFSFNLLATDGTARAGVLRTPHGVIETPIFMPVGTQATVKGLTPEMVREAGAQMILGNTYHLALRPGDELVRDLGGLHRFMHWKGPILTDSGGFQVFSLASQVKITDHGAAFRSHIDGTPLELTPERAVEIQENLGSDIAMVLDECPAADARPERMRIAVDRTIRWAERCRKHHTRAEQAQFAIVQGGLDLALRAECAQALAALDFPGYALGGFSVGEAPEAMHAALPACAAFLPASKPRYLMGVGRPEDLLAGVAAGIDMFDCVLPTRMARHHALYTLRGRVNSLNAKWAEYDGPHDPDSVFPATERYSAAYLRHLFKTGEPLGQRIATLHNLAFYSRMMEEIRGAIENGSWGELVRRYEAC